MNQLHEIWKHGKLGSIREDMGKNYVSVSISKRLIDKIDKLIDSEESTYITKSDFIRDAIRLRLRAFGVKIWIIIIIEVPKWENILRSL